jgi:restriction endonuclease
LLLARDGWVTVVQCKRWRGKPVSVQTVRELDGILHDRGASSAKLIATTNFTPDAVAFAKGKPIELVDAHALLRLLRDVQKSGKIAAPASGEERDHLAPDCPLCGSEMRLKTARRGANAGKSSGVAPSFRRAGEQGICEIGMQKTRTFPVITPWGQGAVEDFATIKPQKTEFRLPRLRAWHAPRKAETLHASQS